MTGVIVACCFLFGLLIGFWMCESEIRKEPDSGKIPKVVKECMLTNNRDKFKDILAKTEEPQPTYVNYKDFEAYERGEK